MIYHRDYQVGFIDPKHAVISDLYLLIAYAPVKLFTFLTYLSGFHLLPLVHSLSLGWNVLWTSVPAEVFPLFFISFDLPTFFCVSAALNFLL